MSTEKPLFIETLTVDTFTDQFSVNGEIENILENSDVEARIGDLDIFDEGDQIWVARLGKKIIGKVKIKHEQGEIFAVMGNVQTDKDYWDRGVARHLLETIFADLNAKGVKEIFGGEYLDDGEKYLDHIYKRLSVQYGMKFIEAQ